MENVKTKIEKLINEYNHQVISFFSQDEFTRQKQLKHELALSRILSLRNFILWVYAIACFVIITIITKMHFIQTRKPFSHPRELFH